MIRQLLAGVTTLLVLAAEPGLLASPQSAIDQALSRLVAGDLASRTQAARDIRRAPPEQAIPTLTSAVRSHPDEYVRFRALVLLTGFGDPATARLMREVMTDRNDRLRTVAYQWFEHHPDVGIVPALVAALDREKTEFVRPALTRALAAQADARARAALLPLVLRGEDLFRGAVISALGDFAHQDAVSVITQVAELDGPLQDDALTALGELGNPESRTTLVTVQASAPRESQPTISASLCLIGVDCDAQVAFIRKSLEAALADPGYQALLRGAVHAQTMLALEGKPGALDLLLDAGAPSRDPARAAIALGLGRVALRNPVLVVETLQTRADLPACLDLLLDAFDMLSEDFEEEQFYVAVRQALWSASEGSQARAVASRIIERLEF
jgi:HEAT repeat protein